MTSPNRQRNHNQRNHNQRTYNHRSSFHRSYCGLCNDTLLRHVRQQQLCFFCPTCRNNTPYADSPLASQPSLQHSKVPVSAATAKKLAKKLSTVKTQLVTAGPSKIAL